MDGQIRTLSNNTVYNLDSVYGVVSQTDATTPIEVDTFNVDTWATGLVAATGGVHTKKCRECMNIKTDALEPKTDSLKVEATLLTAGGAAGILWLALMSG